MSLAKLQTFKWWLRFKVGFMLGLIFSRGRIYYDSEKKAICLEDGYCRFSDAQEFADEHGLWINGKFGNLCSRNVTMVFNSQLDMHRNMELGILRGDGHA